MTGKVLSFGSGCCVKWHLGASILGLCSVPMALLGLCKARATEMLTHIRLLEN